MPRGRKNIPFDECSRGGKNTPREKRSFFMDRDLARRAGSKGGKAPRRKFNVSSNDLDFLMEGGTDDQQTE